MKVKKKDITFIGVHNRRTDHLAYSKEQFGNKPLTASYFHDAMDIYRYEYNRDTALICRESKRVPRKSTTTEDKKAAV